MYIFVSFLLGVFGLRLHDLSFEGAMETMETSSGVEGVGGIGMHVNDLMETSSFLLNDLVAYIRCRLCNVHLFNAKTSNFYGCQLSTIFSHLRSLRVGRREGVSGLESRERGA